MRFSTIAHFAYMQNHPYKSHTKKTQEIVHSMKLHIHDSYATLTNMVQKERLNNYSL